jgi:SAM-dependent methyltransferase
MRTLSPVLRAIVALLGGFLLMAMVGRAGLLPRSFSATVLVLLVGILAGSIGLGLGLSRGWLPLLLFFPWVLDWLLRHPAPGWVWPAGLAVLLLVFGGGILTRVPLYNSNRAAWAALLDLLPPGPHLFADLGAGLGGPLAFLARQRPEALFFGVEASPLTFLAAWLRTLPVRSNCRLRWGSLWQEELGGYDVVYAFLSPAPMPELWAKAAREMRPGSLLVSNTFEVPGREADLRIPLPGRADACLWVWRIPERPD